jgi:hypothetical protein
MDVSGIAPYQGDIDKDTALDLNKDSFAAEALVLQQQLSYQHYKSD